MELRAALESGDPHGYMSSLPVHQDGTCNGLQHYAALGGDDQGARQVNLSVTDRPSDVYTYVAEMVERQVEKDIQAGEKYAQMVTGKVSRKVVKQTVCYHPAHHPICVLSAWGAVGHDHGLWSYFYRCS
jgi:DNA-directed RNA polymerase